MTINFHEIPHPGIRSLIPYKPGKSIEELACEKGLRDIIKMASNENPLGCSPRALVALRQMSAQLVATYPSALHHPLLEKLACTLHVSKDNLFISNGSDYIYTLLLNCFSLHQDKCILTHEYAFSTYAIQANSLNIPVRLATIGQDWQVSVDCLLQACDEKVSIIFLANPNNPTGLLVQSHELKRLLEGIPASTLLVIDEAYYEFAESESGGNTIDWLKDYPNLILTRTFSKIYGLAGLRLGYAIANTPIIELLRRVQLPFTVNQAALTAAHAALDDHDFLELSLKTNQQGMEQMRAGLNELGLDYLPSACNFLTFNCQEDGMLLYNYLLDRGIIVRPLHPYKMDHFIRVSIGTREQNDRFLDALDSYYKRK